MSKSSNIKAVSRIVPGDSYKVPTATALVDLHLEGNEGLRPPPSLLAGVLAAGTEVLRRYPNAGALETSLATFLQVEAEQVVITAGADEAIDRICRAYLEPGREFILPQPTFEMFGHYAKLTGATLVPVLWPGNDYPLQEVLGKVTTNTAVIAVVSPNNPSGATVPLSVIAELAKAAPQCLILLDLAYVEFANEDPSREALKLGNVVITRTLSKAWGLAGLRVGYAAGPTEVIRNLRSAGGPYSVSGLSIAVAQAALASAQEPVASFVACIQQERQQLCALLAELGAEPQDSQANFVLARFKNAAWVHAALTGFGISVRIFGERPGLENKLRITCPGNAEDFARLSRALRCALQPQALLFDMDGVLADVSGSYRRAIQETTASFGASINNTDIDNIKAKGNANNDWVVTQMLLGEKGIKVDLEQVTQRFEELYQGSDQRDGLYKNETLLISADVLENLASRYALAVVTGRPRSDTLRFLEDHNIGHCFKVTVCMEDGPLKPKPEPVLAAMQQLGTDLAWMLGDTPDDIMSARQAVALPIGICAPNQSLESASTAMMAVGAACTLKSFSELEPLLP